MPASRLTVLKIAFAAAGALVLGYGMREDDEFIRWIGIALLAVAFLLRLFNRKRVEDSSDAGGRTRD